MLQITLTNTTSGAYTVQQLNPIDHPTPGVSEENIEFTLNYQVKDHDGDTVDGTLTVNVDDDTPTVVAQSICEDGPAGPGQVANFVLVLDTSGSIELGQLSLIKAAVANFLNSVGASGAQDVRVHIVEFDSDASAVGTYDVIVGGVVNAAAITAATNAVNALTAGGNTNYEAGFQQALQYIEGFSETITVTSSSSFDANSASGNNDHGAHPQQRLDPDCAVVGLGHRPAPPMAT